MLIDIRQILLGKLISNCSVGGGILLKEILVNKWEFRVLCSLSSAQQNQVELNRDLMVLLVYCALTGAPLNICHFKKESCQSILIRRFPWEMNISLWLKTYNTNGCYLNYTSFLPFRLLSVVIFITATCFLSVNILPLLA